MQRVRNVSILLYADDIALIAPNEQALQAMLNKLSEWSSKWRVYVNCSKSKIMHFRKSNTERTVFEFKCGKTVLDYVSSYKYLGITLYEFLKYDENAKLLAEAAGRALGSIVAKYKLHGYMGYNTYSKLYESCVCPVMDYSSGVWGFKNYDKINSVQNKAMRIFLGVHRFAPTLALEGDMGWLMPRYRRWLHILRLWNRLVTMADNRLTKHIFVNDFYLSMSNYDNWCTDVWRILSLTHQEDTFYNREICDLDFTLDKFLELQEADWKKALPRKPKLRFYTMFKESLLVENYVKYNLTISQRSLMAQLRFGILPLHVETGRFRNTKLEERICSLCQLNEIEDECHFLFRCSCYTHIRLPWFNTIKEKCPNFENLDEKTKLVLLFSVHHRCSAKYIQQCFITRKNTMYVM